MAPLTWKNVNAPSNVAAAGLMKSGGEAFSSAFTDAGNLANTIFKGQQKKATDNAIAQVMGLDAAGMDNNQIMQNLGANADKAQVMQAMQNQQNYLSGLDADRLQQQQRQFIVDNQQKNQDQTFDANRLKNLQLQQNIAASTPEALAAANEAKFKLWQQEQDYKAAHTQAANQIGANAKIEAAKITADAKNKGKGNKSTKGNPDTAIAFRAANKTDLDTWFGVEMDADSRALGMEHVLPYIQKFGDEAVGKAVTESIRKDGYFDSKKFDKLMSVY